MQKPKKTELENLAKKLEEELLNSGLPGNAEVGVGLRKLTPKEQRFVLEYTRNQGATKDVREVASRAGYSDPHFGYKLLDKPHIAAEIDRINTAKMAVSLISREYVLSEVISLFNDARNDENRQDRRTMLACLDMIAKMSSFYAPDTTVNVQNNLSSIKIEIVKPEDTTYEDASEE